MLILLLALAMVFTTACTSAEEPAQPAEAPDASGNGAETEQQQPEQPEQPDYSEYNAKAEEVYLYHLDHFVATGELPGGQMVEVLGYGEGDWTNRYAICDIDGDGRNELIIRIADTIMASITENIYAYDEEGDALIEELWASPVCYYYKDGLAIESGWSHGTGAENDDFWPYNAFVYEPETDIYILAGFASQYDLSVMKEKGWEDQFSAEADADGNGIVYDLSDGENLRTVDDAEYEAWRSEVLGTGDPVELPWIPMSELVHPNGEPAASL